MKRYILLIVALLTMSVAMTAEASAQDKAQDNKEKKATKSQIRRQLKAEAEERQIFVIDSILKAQRFTFVAERAITSLQDQPYLTLNYRAYLTVEGNAVRSQLPYYGYSTNASYGTSTSPLDFDAKDITYQTAPLTTKKNGKAFVAIQARSAGKGYTIGIEIFNNGSAAMSVNISAGNGQTFYGYIEPILEKDQTK